MKHTQITRLVEGALMLALATILSAFRLVDLPYGGSVTLASMLPLVLLAYRHGALWGFGCATLFGVLQQLLGLNNLSYFTSPASIIAIILLDYLVAFGVMGCGGLFRRTRLSQPAALCLGATVGCMLRYLCHVVSGATVWAGLSIPTGAALWYSLVYNATYMIPETLVLVLTAYYVGSVLDLTRPVPTRMVREKQTVGAPFWLGMTSALLVFGALVYDVVRIFSHLQDPDSGVFNITLLFRGQVWSPILWVSGICLALAAVCYLVARQLASRRESPRS